MLETIPKPRVSSAERLAFGPFTFDPGSQLLRRDSQVLAVPPRVIGVLQLLLEHAGEVVAKQALIETVWKDAFVTDTSLAEAISFLRQTLGDDPQSPTYIQTVHRRGYRFIAPVNAASRIAAAGAGAVLHEPRGRVSPSIPGQLVPWSIAAICAAAAIAAVWHVTARTQSAPPVVTFELTPSAGTRFDDRAPAIALSPDGTRLAWSGCDDAGCRLYLRFVDRLQPTMLPTTEDAQAPFFSPDGEWIGYFADGKLRKVAVSGGASVPLADSADALGGVWTRDGGIVFAGARAGLSAVGEDGLNLRRLTAPNEADGELRHAWPSLTADGTVLLFTVVTAPGGETPGRIAAMPRLAGTDRPSWKAILDDAGRAQALSNDAIVFSRGADLVAIAFDAPRIGISGPPHVVAAGLAATGTAGQFAVASSGSLAYMRAETAGAPDRQSFASASLSPEGSRVAAAIREGVRTDLWVASLDSGTATRLTHDGANVAPLWSPDGRVIVFAKRSGGAYEVWKRSSDASSPESRVFSAEGHVLPSSVSADGQRLVVTRSHPETGLDIWSVTAGGVAQPIVRTPFDETAGSFSPDGRLIAYQSNESGRWEIHVMRLNDRRRSVVSANGGIEPAWDSQGSRIRYWTRGSTTVATLAPDADPRVVTTADAPSLPPTPVGIDAAGRVRFSSRPAVLDRAIVTLSFDRELREILGPRPGTMPR